MKQTDTLVQALRLLASDIHCCEEDVVTSVIREAVDKIEHLEEVRVSNNRLIESLIKSVDKLEAKCKFLQENC